MPLERENERYAEIKEYLLEHHEGKVALIYESELIGTWDTREAAYAVGIERFGNVPFLIKQILKQDPVESIPALVLGVL